MHLSLNSSNFFCCIFGVDILKWITKVNKLGGPNCFPIEFLAGKWFGDPCHGNVDVWENFTALWYGSDLCNDVSFTYSHSRVMEIPGSGMSVNGMKSVSAFVVDTVFYIYRFSQKVIVDVNDISGIHYRDFCAVVNTANLSCIVSVKAEVYSFVRRGPGAVICPPCFRFLE